jgi:hypothetical protein
MSKNELKDYVVEEMAKTLQSTGQSCDPEDMIAIAYNKAIDDAVGVVNKLNSVGATCRADSGDLLKLKI